jgi:phosphate transport system protein
MNHLDTELKSLKANVISMWLLVISQLEKSRKAILLGDKDIVQEIKINEKRVDEFEVKLNLDCENILALFNPVAVDLRFVVAVLKINYNLERIGDYAKSIADYSNLMSKKLDKKVYKTIGLQDMFELSFTMLNDALRAFENEDAQLLRSIFQLDKDLDKMNDEAVKKICEWIQIKSNEAPDALNLHSMVRKLERVGDQVKNIGTEIIFHTEAKMLLHTKKKRILKELDKGEKDSK